MNLTRRSSCLRGATGASRYRPGRHERPDRQASAVAVLRLRCRRRWGRLHSPLLTSRILISQGELDCNVSPTPCCWFFLAAEAAAAAALSLRRDGRRGIVCRGKLGKRNNERSGRRTQAGGTGSGGRRVAGRSAGGARRLVPCRHLNGRRLQRHDLNRCKYTGDAELILWPLCHNL